MTTPNLIARNLRAFVRDQSGNMSFLGLSGAMIMMVFGGIGIDMAHAELKRVKLQNALDSAVLAAANLENPLDAQTVVETYFEAAGLSDALVSVDAQFSGGLKTVTAQAATASPSNFFSLIGIDTLHAEGAATAAQAAGAVEISVVLDVSSSMWGNSRLANLKTAMGTFINEVIPDGTNPADSLVSINLVPYSLTVNPGDLAQYYTIEGKHAYSDCVWFENTHFDTLGLDPDASQERYSHFADNSSGYEADGTIDLPMCPDMTITAMETNRQILLDEVQALRGWDGTGIDIGVKWGLHMLDPSFRPVTNALIAAEERPASLAGRPFNYGGTARKMMILMSDGENDSQRDLREELREGAAPIWEDGQTGHLSVLVQDGRTMAGFDPANDVNSVWYWDRTGALNAFPDGPHHTNQNGAGNGDGTGNSGGPRTDWGLVASHMEQITWPDVFNLVSEDDLFGRFFAVADAQGYLTPEEKNAYDNPIDWSRISNADTNQRLSDICALARAQGVEIYTIAFEPPSQQSRDALADCASSSAHFFDAQGLEISTVFGSIARNLTKLKLTD